MALQRYATSLYSGLTSSAAVPASVSTTAGLTVSSGTWTNHAKMVFWNEDPLVATASDGRTYTYKVSAHNNAPWEVNMNGNYGDDIECLADGLAKAVEQGWITSDEAKVEFRSRVNTTRVADDEAKYQAEKKALLEKELAELQAGEKVV